MAVQKISVNLSDQVLAALREMSTREEITMTEALRRSISTMKYLLDAQAEGKVVLLRDPSTKETERLVFQ